MVSCEDGRGGRCSHPPRSTQDAQSWEKQEVLEEDFSASPEEADTASTSV